MSAKSSLVTRVGTCVFAVAASIALPSAQQSAVDSAQIMEEPSSADFAIPISVETPRTTAGLYGGVGTNIFDVMKRMESGERAAEEIDHELTQIAGQNSFSLKKARLKGKYKLAMVLSHFNDLSSGLQIMSVHSMKSQSRNNEDILTMYTNRITDADEDSIRASLVVAKSLEFKNGALVSDGKARYLWKMQPHSSLNTFRVREPEAEYELNYSPTAIGNSIDPFALIAEAEKNSKEIEPGVYKILRPSGSSQVELTTRMANHETFTIEANIRESSDDYDSLKTYSFVLVFEPA